MSQPMVQQKRCGICGQDVAGKPRFKDLAGNYYCQPCYAQASTSPTQTESVTCTRCHSRCAIDKAYDQDGVILCHDCWHTAQGDLADLTLLESLEKAPK